MKVKISFEDGVYNINCFCKDTLQRNSEVYIGTLVLDVKRSSYYLIPTKSKKYGENMSSYFIAEMNDLFLNALAEKTSNEQLTGSLKVYAEKMLINLINEMEKEKEEQEDEEYYRAIKKYNLGYYPEEKFYKNNGR